MELVQSLMALVVVPRVPARSGRMTSRRDSIKPLTFFLISWITSSQSLGGESLGEGVVSALGLALGCELGVELGTADGPSLDMAVGPALGWLLGVPEGAA
jgi:hypothetical protein